MPHQHASILLHPLCPLVGLWVSQHGLRDPVSSGHSWQRLNWFCHWSHPLAISLEAAMVGSFWKETLVLVMSLTSFVPPAPKRYVEVLSPQYLKMWSYLEIAKNAKDCLQTQKLEEVTKAPLKVSEGAWSFWHLDFRLLVSRTVE